MLVACFGWGSAAASRGSSPPPRRACSLAGLGAYGALRGLDEAAFADRPPSTLQLGRGAQEVAARIGRAGRRRAARAGARRGRRRGRRRLGHLARPGVPGALPHRRRAHAPRAVLGPRRRGVARGSPGSGAALRAELGTGCPDCAAALPRIGDPPLLSVGSTGREHALRAARARRRARSRCPLAIVFGAARPRRCSRSAIARAADRRRAHLGRRAGGRRRRRPDRGGRHRLRATSCSTHFDTELRRRRRLAVVWNAYLGDLRVWALALVRRRPGRRRRGRRPAPGRASLLAAPPSRGGRLSARPACSSPRSPSSARLVLHIGSHARRGLVYVAAGDLLRVFAPPRAPPAACAPQRVSRAAGADRGRRGPGERDRSRCPRVQRGGPRPAARPSAPGAGLRLGRRGSLARRPERRSAAVRDRRPTAATARASGGSGCTAARARAGAASPAGSSTARPRSSPPSSSNVVTTAP